VTEQTGFDVLRFKGLTQESVVAEIELGGADIIRGAEMGVDLIEAFLRRVHASSFI
jgi:hypothetical protein